MLVCSKCNLEVAEKEAKFCPECGTALILEDGEASIPVDTEDVQTCLKKDLQGWGIGLIVVGIISILVSDFLDPLWGAGLIVVGLLAFLIQKRGMFILLGVILLLAGVMNILNGLYGESTGWGALGCLQIYWGIQEIRKYWKYGSVLGIHASS